jgi:hypothetical protein
VTNTRHVGRDYKGRGKSGGIRGRERMDEKVERKKESEEGRKGEGREG